MRQLWQQSRHLYHTLGAEDLPALLADQIAILATDAEIEAETDWGFVCIEAEERPPTLPITAPNRVYLRALALTSGRAPSRYVAELLDRAIKQLPPAPQGQLLIAYADADVYFYKGWLPSSLDALRTLPQAGMVTAMPMLTPQKYSTATVKWAKAQRGAKLESGPLFSWDDFWRHARSLGNSEEHGRTFFKDNKAVRLSYKKRQYWVGAAHFQFMARKRILQQVLPIPAEKPMGRVRLLDEAINALGYLRLSTAEWHVQHMGNQLPAADDLLDGSLAAPAARRARGASFWAWPPLRKLLQWLNGWTFDRIHRTQK